MTFRILDLDVRANKRQPQLELHYLLGFKSVMLTATISGFTTHTDCTEPLEGS